MTPATIEDRRLLTDAVRAAVSGASPRPFISQEQGCGTDDSLWKTLTQQIGVAGLLVPEELGGAGAGVAEIADVITECGAHLTPVPALATLGMAGALLAIAPDSDTVRALETRLAEGTPATVAWPNPAGPDLTPQMRVQESPDGPVLHGRADFVLDGMAAQVVIAPALATDGVVLVSVETDADGILRTPMTALDLTRGMARMAFDGTPVTVLTEPAPSADFLAPGLDIALTCMAAEQVGVAARCHDEAVNWARERIQFDRPIGSFQAIKHSLVNLLMDLELARSVLEVAVRAADTYLDMPTEQSALALRTAASAAKAMCGDAATRLTDESLHIFGGIGFTWEHDAHLYFRRAKALDLMLGAPADHRARLAAALGVGPSARGRGA
ncbi:acyl-CoA/acyl-ACP dehydrogenase [Rhodococcus sp. CX]|uniref:acyl-CoA dehydrogenase family protein n=1 Tax=Rhodococcus sp. CX TaxID=2789880 RepID=UPI0018CF2510|nr:acyl-CoA dehydrogenase family protein [Rhodococcus sp. CX]MBH0119526.1 acyl-CoA/acyl-ACP dehydrogenase [Rhodococcus sp. CX]